MRQKFLLVVGGIVIKLENSLHPEHLWKNANRDELLCAIFDCRKTPYSQILVGHIIHMVVLSYQN